MSTNTEIQLEVYVQSSWTGMSGQYLAFNAFSKLFVFLGRMIVQHISLIKKNKNLVHKVILSFLESKKGHNSTYSTPNI